MVFRIRIGGHRGFGCTDSAFAIANNGLKNPPENTQASFTAVFGPKAKADFIETDVVRTGDDRLVLCHSTDLTHHVPEEFRPIGISYIDELTLAETRRLRTGPHGNGKIPSLRNVLADIQRRKPGRGMVLNLEIKDVQGTTCPSRQPSFAKLVLEDIKKAHFPLSRIRFSSFSLGIVSELARLEPKAKLGMLFDIPQKRGGSIGKPLFVDRKDVFLGFTPAAVKHVLKHVPHLENLHPETRDVTPKMVALAAKHKLGITVWGYMEKSPLQDAAWAAATHKAITLCRQHNVPLEIITDHAADMRKFVAQELKKSSGK